VDFEGIEFAQKHQTRLWQGPVDEVEFGMKAGAELEGQTVHGYLRVHLGLILLAEVSISIEVNSRMARSLVGMTAAGEFQPVPHYRKIFASYAHSDVTVVEQFERLAEAIGDEYLRDVRDIRAGEEWNERLKELIREADVFQLFWSRNSMRSEFVREEWEYALSLGRKNFVRPTYWEVPMPEDRSDGLPPASLLRLQFKRVPFYDDLAGLTVFWAKRERERPSLRPKEAYDERRNFEVIPHLSPPVPGPVHSPLFAIVAFVLVLLALGLLIWYLLK
jgi:hypothetical protein